MKIENEFIPYEQALALKDLGFTESSLKCWFPNPNDKRKTFIRINSDTLLPNQFKTVEELMNEGVFTNTIYAPLYQQAFRFFREKYNIIPNIHSVYIDETHTKINFWVWFANYEENSNEEIYYGTYEEAELECLKKLIEIVKDGK